MMRFASSRLGRAFLSFTVALVVLLLPGCATQKRIRSNALEYLYPAGSEVREPGDVRLVLPVRVGIAFAPTPPERGDTFDENQKQELLERVAAAFRDRDGIASVEVLPSHFLTARGGFEDLARIRAGFGIDVVALVSYDQFQFSSSGRSSWTYWTLLGAYVVKGEKNETKTFLDAVVYDITSATMLFNASGQSAVGGRSTPIQLDKALRDRSREGFSAATDDLIGALDGTLEAFLEQAKSGTVRGEGTPAIAIADEAGRPVAPGGGAGSLGLLEIALAAIVAAAPVAGGRSTRRRSRAR